MVVTASKADGSCEIPWVRFNSAVFLYKVDMFEEEQEESSRAKLTLKIELNYNTKNCSSIVMLAKLHSLIRKLAEDGSLDGYELSHKIYTEGISDEE